MTPYEEVLALLCAIVYASDSCRGHRGCWHSMQPWTDARAFLVRLDTPPAPSVG